MLEGILTGAGGPRTSAREGHGAGRKETKGKEEKERRALTSLMCRGVEDGSSHAPKAHGLSLKLYADEPSNCVRWKILFSQSFATRLNGIPLCKRFRLFLDNRLAEFV